MATRPTAVRGKTTKKSKMKKTLAAAVKGLKAGIKGTAKSKLGKSPGDDMKRAANMLGLTPAQMKLIKKLKGN